MASTQGNPKVEEVAVDGGAWGICTEKTVGLVWGNNFWFNAFYIILPWKKKRFFKGKQHDTNFSNRRFVCLRFLASHGMECFLKNGDSPILYKNTWKVDTMNQFWGRHISDDFVEWLSLFDSGSIPLDERLDGMSLKRALYVFASFFQAAILILWGVGDFLEHPKNNHEEMGCHMIKKLGCSVFTRG